jgi:YjbE family integral membrane protein
VTGIDLFLIGLCKVVLLNLILSGDNAVVIALASRGLAPRQQRKAYFWGSIGAILLRILLTFVVIGLLAIPYLQAAGGLLLLVIAAKLLKQEEETQDIKSHRKLSAAVRTIILSDLIMSLDNMVAVAGAADGNLLLIVTALVISIPFIIWGAGLLNAWMRRFPLLVFIGAGVLGYTAGEMILDDKVTGPYLKMMFPTVAWLLPGLLAATLLYYGKRQSKKIVPVRPRHARKV